MRVRARPQRRRSTRTPADPEPTPREEPPANESNDPSPPSPPAPSDEDRVAEEIVERDHPLV